MKPIYLMHEDGLTPLQAGAVVEGINQVLRLAGLYGRMEVRNYKAWRNDNWIANNLLKAYQSIDWYLARAKTAQGRFNVEVMSGDLISEPWQQALPHYDVVVTHSGALTESNGGWYIGCGMAYIGAIISTEPFNHLDPDIQRECIITETMHEVCHMFYTPYDKRGYALTEALGLHCTNECIMRQGWSVPHDWISMSTDRLRHGALCSACQADLYHFFEHVR